MATNLWVKTGTGWHRAKGIFRYVVGIGWVPPNGIYVQSRELHPARPYPAWVRINGSDFTKPTVSPDALVLTAGHNFEVTASWTNTALVHSVGVLFEVLDTPSADWDQRTLLPPGASSCTASFTAAMYDAEYVRIRARAWYWDEGGDGPSTPNSNEVLLRP